VAVATLAAAGALALPARAIAHEVEAEVVRGRAVAVRAVVAGGRPLADADAEVFSPARPAAPAWRGRTDGQGWVLFLPDVPGRWRVRIVDAQGHGLDTSVEVAAPGASGPGEADGRSAPGSGHGHEPAHGHGEGRTPRLLLGVGVIAVVFAGGLLLRRRRRT
jgi:nickel transport protein